MRAALSADTAAIALTSAIKSKPAALHGMGGIGKSVVARTLCDDPVVQAAFPDGILWATLGQTPDLIARLREWITVLGGTVSENVPTVESLKATLAGLLSERTCLLIVDDVWQCKHAQTFQMGGPRCRLLLTTRDAEIARELGAQIQQIPPMTRTEAVALLEEWADGKLVAVDQELKQRIVERLGRLPLAVKLAGAQLQHKAPDEWLRTFDARRLTSRRPEDIHDSLEDTFKLSLNILGTDERRQYIGLAIFKEDEPIRAAGIQRLWQALGGLDDEATANLIDDLAARALLEYRTTETIANTESRFLTEKGVKITKTSASADPSSRTIAATSAPFAVVLHDLLRDFVKAELGDQYVATHQKLLDSYHATRTGAGWHSAHDDGYLYNHLAYHLDAVGAADELKGLFADQAWMRVRVPRDDYTYEGYLADLDRAWKYVDAEIRLQIDDKREPTTFQYGLRYALIRTSVNSIAGNYVPELVARAIETELWTTERALSVAAKIPTAEQKVRMYRAILKTSRLSEQRQAGARRLGLAAALVIADVEARTQALISLAPYLTGEQRSEAMQAGLAAALMISDVQQRLRALAAMMPHLSSEQFAQAVQHRLEIARTMADNVWQGRALAALAPELAGEQQVQALQMGLSIAQKIPNRADRAEVLTGLIPYLDQEQRIEAVQQCLSALQTTEQTWKGIHALRALVALLPYVSSEQHDQSLQQAFDMAMSLTNKEERAQALLALVPHLVGEQRTQAIQEGLDTIPTMSAQWQRAEMLARLAPHLTGALLLQGLDVTFELDAQVRAEALVALVPHVTEEQQLWVLQRTLEAIQALPYEWQRAQALMGLAPQLTGLPLQQGLEVALALAHPTHRRRALAALAPYLTGPLLQQGLEVALIIPDEDARTRALAGLALPPTEKRQPDTQNLISAAAQAVTDDQDFLSMLEILPSISSDERETQFIPVADLTTTLTHEQDPARVVVVATLAQHLTTASQPWALATALAINDAQWRAKALRALLPLASDYSPLLDAIRHALSDHLLALKDRHRRDVLEFCADATLLSPPIFTNATLAAFAAHIVEICQAWRWL